MVIKSKNKFFIVIVALLAISLSIYNLINDVYYLFVDIGYIILSVLIWNKIKYPVYLISLYLIVHNALIYFLLKYQYIYASVMESRLEVFMPSLFMSIIILFLPYLVLYVHHLARFGTGFNLEKRNYFEKNHPDLVCKKHLRRVHSTSSIDYKNIQCRSNEDCDIDTNFIFAVKLIGQIGLNKRNRFLNNNYYVKAWNNNTKKFKDGDYDILEIHQNNKIEDYNSIIYSISNILFNEIDRYIPIFKMQIRIFGELNLSKSTKRLLKERFFKVEYFENK